MPDLVHEMMVPVMEISPVATKKSLFCSRFVKGQVLRLFKHQIQLCLFNQTLKAHGVSWGGFDLDRKPGALKLLQ